MIAKPLTQAEVDALPEGQAIVITWRGRDATKYDAYGDGLLPYYIGKTQTGMVVACKDTKKKGRRPVAFLVHVNEPDGPIVHAMGKK